MFKSLYIKWQRTIIPERQKTNMIMPFDCQVYFLERVLGDDMGSRGKRDTLVYLKIWGDTPKESRESRVDRIHRHEY